MTATYARRGLRLVDRLGDGLTLGVHLVGIGGRCEVGCDADPVPFAALGFVGSENGDICLRGRGGPLRAELRLGCARRRGWRWASTRCRKSRATCGPRRSNGRRLRSRAQGTARETGRGSGRARRVQDPCHLPAHGPAWGDRASEGTSRRGRQRPPPARRPQRHGPAGAVSLTAPGPEAPPYRPRASVRAVTSTSRSLV